MAIDLKTETVIPTQKVPKLIGPIGRNGSFMSYAQVMRGVLKGFNGHRLEAWRCGSRWLTTVQAVERWLEAQASSAVDAAKKSATASPCDATDRAGRELTRRGI